MFIFSGAMSMLCQRALAGNTVLDSKSQIYTFTFLFFLPQQKKNFKKERKRKTSSFMSKLLYISWNWVLNVHFVNLQN